MHRVLSPKREICCRIKIDINKNKNSFMDNDSMKKNNSLGDVEIRTMKDDLENSNYKKESPLPENYVVSPTKTSPFVPPKPPFIPVPKPSPTPVPKLSPTSSSTSLPPATESPFFNQKSWDKKEEKRKEDIYMPARDEKDETKKSGMGGIIFSSVLISVILIAGVGAYYFWMTRVDKERSVNIDLLPNNLNNENEENLMEDDITVETQDTGEFSSESPNYLMLSDEQVTKESVAALLDETSEKIITSGAKTPLEFIVTDNKNNPLLFKVFAQIAGISLPLEVINNLDQDFSLYFFNEEGKMKLGMGIDSKNDIDLKVALLQEEKSLFSSLRMLYLDYVITEQEMTFSESIYLDQYVRYYNLDSADKLSLDYTVYGEKGRLYFAISEKTLKAILDYAINK